MFCTTDSTLSPSPLKMLCRHIVDHHTLPVVCSLCPSRQFPYWSRSSSTLLYVKTPLPYLRHFNCQQPHVYLLSISEYGHAQSKYHMFSFPCHMFVLFFHMFICKIFHMLIALCYPLCFIPSVYKLRVSVLYFLSFEYQI